MTMCSPMPMMSCGGGPGGHAAGPAAATDGHRDTHFAFLEQVQVNDLLELESADGVTHRYRVGRTSVVHENEIDVMALGKKKKLTLITCFPFDGLRSGTPYRYVVNASQNLENNSLVN